MPEIANVGYEEVPIGSVEHYPENPRKGDVGAIYESIEENDFFGACVVQRSTGYILAGNHRYRAAQEAGFDTIPVIFVDVDDARARKIALADNRTNDLSGYDDDKLLEVLRMASESDPLLLGTGYSPNELDDLEDQLEGPGVAFDGDRRLTPEERFKVYESTNVRQIMLILQSDEYDWAMDKLKTIAGQRGLPTHGDVLMALLAERFNEALPTEENG